jgi:hypothetical protein
VWRTSKSWFCGKEMMSWCIRRRWAEAEENILTGGFIYIFREQDFVIGL